MRKDHRHYIICDDTRKVCKFCKETIEAPDPAERTDGKDVDPDEDAAEAPHRRQASHFGGAAAAR